MMKVASFWASRQSSVVFNENKDAHGLHVHFKQLPQTSSRTRPTKLAEIKKGGDYTAPSKNHFLLAFLKK